MKKYKCLLPTNGYVAGDIVEMTAEEFAGVNANEPTPRFEEIEDIAVSEEAENGSGDADDSVSDEDAPTETEETIEDEEVAEEVETPEETTETEEEDEVEEGA